jgi:hypothetical protein
MLPPTLPTPLVSQKRPATLKTPATSSRAARCKASTTGGGGGLFALLALGGMICFVNYHAVLRPVTRPASRVNFQPAIPTLPAIPPARYNYTSNPSRISPAPARWVIPPPPMPQPPSVRIDPPQAPIYWGPYDQSRAWRDGRTRSRDE